MGNATVLVPSNFYFLSSIDSSDTRGGRSLFAAVTLCLHHPGGVESSEIKGADATPRPRDVETLGSNPLQKDDSRGVTRLPGAEWDRTRPGS